MTRRRRPSAPSIAAMVSLATVPAVVLAGAWGYAAAKVPPATTTTTTTVPAEPPISLTTPLLSMRRHPTPIAERAAADAATAALSGRTQALLDALPDGSCALVRDDDVVVAEAGDGVAVIPASNQKLITAAVALAVLGPDHRFRTELRSPQPFLGVVPGDLYIVGGGDPLLRTADVPDPLPFPSFNTTALEALADQLVAIDITTIEGDLIGDGSRYDDELRPTDEWGEGISEADGGRIDALIVNDGLVSPGTYGLDPVRAATGDFADLLAERGITVVGSPSTGTAAPDVGLITLAMIESPPLTDVLVEMLHTSDNNTAEMVLKEIGFVASGVGSRQAGLDAARATLEAWGVPTDGLDLRDGSGLSRNNRATCDTLAALVADTPVASELVALLPTAGRDGTLATQLVGTPAEGQLVAKTGTLTDVRALTGMQPGRDGRRVEFALILNGPGVDEPALYGPRWQALVELIAAYPVPVDVDVEPFAPEVAE